MGLLPASLSLASLCPSLSQQDPSEKPKKKPNQPEGKTKEKPIRQTTKTHQKNQKTRPTGMAWVWVPTCFSRLGEGSGSGLDQPCSGLGDHSSFSSFSLVDDGSWCFNPVFFTLFDLV
jgi:hypothetical protein